ncbi:hypothetical protein V1514DRAFT_325982 [Lipomyces japonicus]|uniref:uncharacterized protein n=1 Tax=Lipomyces japonicus TaxID=56871 RepID=UPI0034CD3A0A
MASFLQFPNMGVGDFNDDGTPRPGYLARMYWAAVGSFLALAFAVRIADFALGWQRKRSLSAAPRWFPAKIQASLTSIGRIITYPTLNTFHSHTWIIYMPSFGRIFIVASYFAILFGLFFYKNPISKSSAWEAASYRSGWISIAQLPLLILLSTKRLNIISFLTGASSHVSLNYFHRWVARGVLFTTTIHMFYTMRYYASFQFLTYQLSTDAITRRGLGTWCVLASICLITSVRPLRYFFYDLFFATHVASVIAFFVMVLFHTPYYAHKYTWIALGFYIADVVLRFGYLLFYNVSRKGIRHRAVVSVSSDEKLLTIEIPANGRSWKAGEHIGLLFPTAAFSIKSHPFTVCSTPESDSMRFVVRVKNGFTKRLMRRTLKLGTSIEEKDADIVAFAEFPVLINGGHGLPARNWGEFSSVCAISVGAGASYGFSVLESVLKNQYATQQVELLWIVRRYTDIGAFIPSIDSVIKKTDVQSITLTIKIFITDPTTITSDKYDFLDSELTEICTGRPHIRSEIANVLNMSAGETAIAVCGSAQLSAEVRTQVAILLDARAAHTGSGTQGCYVHTERFFAE